MRSSGLNGEGELSGGGNRLTQVHLEERVYVVWVLTMSVSVCVHRLQNDLYCVEWDVKP